MLVSPAHSFPMGVVLDGLRRRGLLDWAADGGIVIEDDYDAEHRYDRPPVTALRAALPDGVCYTGSASKILAPALRIGWLLPPAGLLDDVVAAKLGYAATSAGQIEEGIAILGAVLGAVHGAGRGAMLGACVARPAPPMH